MQLRKNLLAVSSLILLSGCGIGGADTGPRVVTGTFNSSLQYSDTVDLAVEALENNKLKSSFRRFEDGQIGLIAREEGDFRIITTVSPPPGFDRDGTTISIWGSYYAVRSRGLRSMLGPSNTLSDADPDAVLSLEGRFEGAFEDLAEQDGISPVLFYTTRSCVTFDGENRIPCGS